MTVVYLAIQVFAASLLDTNSVLCSVSAVSTVRFRRVIFRLHLLLSLCI